jgi:hypothetical protein
MAGMLRGQKDADEQKESPGGVGASSSNKGERLGGPETVDVRMRPRQIQHIAETAIRKPDPIHDGPLRIENDAGIELRKAS